MSAALDPQESSEPVDFSALNRQYYQEEGPADYILGRLYGLVAIGGQTDEFLDLIGSGVKFHNLELRLGLVEGDDGDADLEEAKRTNERFRDHFVRIEIHNLKHLTVETLLRLFLAHRRRPPCPWSEITGNVRFGEFKDEVRASIANGAQEQLERDVACMFLGADLMPGDGTDDEEAAVANLVGFLRRFADSWLDEAKSYNSTKHGLTAIPGAAVFDIAAQGEEPVRLGEGDSLAHLTFKDGEANRRNWSLTTRWIRPREALEVITVAHHMLDALWSIARCRYGVGRSFKKFALPPEVFSPSSLGATETSGALTETSMTYFWEQTDTSVPRH